jgi:hypothetical protein
VLRCGVSLRSWADVSFESRSDWLNNKIVHAAWLLGLVGCAAAGGPDSRTQVMELSERFRLSSAGAAVASENAGRSMELRMQVLRNGTRRDALVLIAPAVVRASLAGVSGRVIVQALATPVFNIGDGLQMDVSLTEGPRVTRIFSRYFDAGRKAADRAWVPLAIPVDLGNSSNAELSIAVSAGPQGDLVGDWLALSALRLVPEAGRR